jgi:hypothetical protein
LNAVSELQGKLTGTSGWVGADLYTGESMLTLHIREDGTFTASVKPNGGTGNWVTFIVRSGDTLVCVRNAGSIIGIVNDEWGSGRSMLSCGPRELSG